MRGIEGLDAFMRDLDAAPRGLPAKVKPIMSKGGLQMKRKMQEDLRGSQSFGHIARSVDYDRINKGLGIEVGPNAATSRSAPLAGIAYFGGANGGGGTVPEPDYILEAEAETAADFIADAMRDLL